MNKAIQTATLLALLGVFGVASLSPEPEPHPEPEPFADNMQQICVTNCITHPDGTTSCTTICY